MGGTWGQETAGLLTPPPPPSSSAPLTHTVAKLQKLQEQWRVFVAEAVRSTLLKVCITETQIIFRHTHLKEKGPVRNDCRSVFHQLLHKMV